MSEGWTYLLNSRKWHYFINGISLCGKFMLPGRPELEQGNDSSPETALPAERSWPKEKGLSEVQRNRPNRSHAS